MSYTPTEWEPTDVVTATRMNALETAVGEMNMSYTPNTWSDGDILTAAKMNALEQAVASGGGGSDFSTAEVTIVNTAEDTDVYIYTTIAGDDELLFNDVAVYGTTTFIVVLYKGSARANIDFDTLTSMSGSVTGSIEDGFTVTGDCTLTGTGTGII